jgi:hypothetical protein
MFLNPKLEALTNPCIGSPRIGTASNGRVEFVLVMGWLDLSLHFAVTAPGCIDFV